MAYTKRTCAECGWRAPQPEMVLVERRVEVARSRGSVSASTLVGAFLGHKASARKVGNAIFNTGQRTYTRRVRSWLCPNCAGNTQKVEEKGGRLGITFLAIAGFAAFIWLFGSEDNNEALSTEAKELSATEIGPSFDCSRATTPTENAICGSTVLSRLDLQLDTSFKVAKAALPGVMARDIARVLIQDREFCKDNEACIGEELTRAVYQFNEMSRFPLAEMQERFIALPDTERRVIQEYLASNGDYMANVDGQWGPKTAEAIYTFLTRTFGMAGTLENYNAPSDVLQEMASRGLQFQKGQTGMVSLPNSVR